MIDYPYDHLQNIVIPEEDHQTLEQMNSILSNAVGKKVVIYDEMGYWLYGKVIDYKNQDDSGYVGGTIDMECAFRSGYSRKFQEFKVFLFIDELRFVVVV